MRDTGKRLQVFKSIQSIIDGIDDDVISINSSEEALEKDRKKAVKIHSLYEWDIHPNEYLSEAKLTSEPSYKYARSPEKSSNNTTINQPPITLLINNYVKSKISSTPSASHRIEKRVVDPSTIYRLPERQEKQKGHLATMLKLVPSRIEVPMYRPYELTKHPSPLPGISAVKN